MYRRSLLLGLGLGVIACRTGDKGGASDAAVDSGAIQVEDLDGDGFGADEDCDDADASVRPDAIERCDGIDNNCNGEVDEGVELTWYADADRDGFGDPDSAYAGCEGETGAVPNGNDCDDAEPERYPGNVEICDGIDNDCDGELDEGLLSSWWTDADNDGFGDPGTEVVACRQPPGTADNDGDCDDSAAPVNPDALEICDGIDNDCDGSTDGPDAAGRGTWFLDADGDGHGDPDSPLSACTQPANSVTDATDCDDADFDINPDGNEVCDSIDNDCDGLVDNDDPSWDRSSGGTWYRDTDGDGYGDAASPVQACDAPAATVRDATDCDDSTSAVHPSAAEICDGQDNDCDGAGDPMDGSAQACPAEDCIDVLSFGSAVDGRYWVDPNASGSAYEVWCDQSTEGGGWTLAYVVSNDGQDSWTWQDRDLLGADPTLFGSLSARDQDLKSPAHHDLLFFDLLFVHSPSGVTAEYEGVGDGTQDLGSYIDAIPAPLCDASMAGNGAPLTGGSLTLGGNMCDTDLYFNLGDHESGLAYCLDLSVSYNHATYGPVWSLGNNNGCPFDDPSGSALGPQNPCASCTAGTELDEGAGLGFAGTLGLNTGTAGSGQNRMSVYIR